MTEQAIFDEFYARGAEHFKPPYRGEIWECFADVPMGRGYANEGLPFDIRTANYLRDVQREIRSRPFGKFVCKAAVQMGKTLGCVEQPVGYFIMHEPGDMTVYLPAEAMDQAKSRLMPYIKALPGVANLVDAVEAGNRFDITTAEFYLPGMTLRVWPLNEGSTQRITLRYVLISDAYLAKSDGMIQQAIARTTQHNSNVLRDYKIIIESQGGIEGDDFDKEWHTTDMRELHVNCPACGTSQPFAWTRYRPDDFVPVPPLIVPSLDHTAWIAHHRELFLKADHRYSGMKRGAEELIKRDDGSYNEREVLRHTYYECFYCGSAWQDNPETRRQLDESSHYVATNPNALPENVGFSWPAWAGQRLAWGGDHCMLGYLRAKHNYDKLGNREDLKQWYQKRAATAWNSDLGGGSQDKMPANISDDAPIVGEKIRIGAVDCQFNLTHLVYQCWAIGDGTPPRLLHYEWIKPPARLETDSEKREFCQNRVRALNAEHKIQQQNFMVDAGHRPDLVREWAARDAVYAPIKVGQAVRKKWVTYGLLIGDDRASYKWDHPGRTATYERFKRRETVLVDTIQPGGKMRMPICHQLWSNPSIKEIAARWRDGDGAPQIQVPERFRKDGGKEGFWAQMNSERKLPWKGRPGKERWDNEGKPNHAWDGWCMVMVRMDQLEYLTSFGAPQADSE